MATGNERYTDSFAYTGPLQAPWKVISDHGVGLGLPRVLGGLAGNGGTSTTNFYAALYDAPMTVAQFMEVDVVNLGISESGSGLSAMMGVQATQATGVNGNILSGINSVLYSEEADGAGNPTGWWLFDGNPFGNFWVNFNPEGHRWFMGWDGHKQVVLCDGLPPAYIVGDPDHQQRTRNWVVPRYLPTADPARTPGQGGPSIAFVAPPGGSFSGRFANFACGSWAPNLTIDSVVRVGSTVTLSGKRFGTPNSGILAGVTATVTSQVWGQSLISLSSNPGLKHGDLIAIPGASATGRPYTVSYDPNWTGPADGNANGDPTGTTVRLMEPLDNVVSGVPISFTGDLVTVAAPGATVGPVTYPDNQTWQCVLTNVPTGIAATISASDGEVVTSAVLIPPVALPATLDATNANANTTASVDADGTSLDATAGEVAEWSVDGGAGGTFSLTPTVSALHWARVALSVGGAPQGTFMVEGSLDIEEDDTMPASNLGGDTNGVPATVAVNTSAYVRLDVTPLANRSRILVTTDPAGTTRVGIVYSLSTSIPPAGTLPSAVLGQAGDSLPPAVGAVGTGIYVYGKALDGAGNVGVQQLA